MANIPDISPPHFKSIVKQQRNNNYDLFKILSEFIDNVIKKCNEIEIKITVNDNRLYKIQISDSYINGFENILEKGIKNPFNMGHCRIGQEDDNEMSEYGIGLKAGAIACANVLTIYTKVENKYYNVKFDFVNMSKKENIENSYKPEKFEEININEYKKYHNNFLQGSTLILKSIHHSIYNNTTSKDLIDKINKYVSKHYSNIIKTNGTKITILNDDEKEKKIVEEHFSFFDDKSCIPFTKSYKLYYFQKDNITKLLCSNNNYFYEYNEKNKVEDEDDDEADEKTKKTEIIQTDNSLNKMINDGYETYYHINENDKWCIEIDTTFVFFSNNICDCKVKICSCVWTEKEKLPKAVTEIYKDGRLYGIMDNLSISKDGYKNHVLHRINFKSKYIGKELGITCNKFITLKKDNNLIKFIKAIIKKNQKLFTNKPDSVLLKKLCDIAKKEGLEINNEQKIKLDDKKVNIITNENKEDNIKVSNIVKEEIKNNQPQKNISKKSITKKNNTKIIKTETNKIQNNKISNEKQNNLFDNLNKVLSDDNISNDKSNEDISSDDKHKDEKITIGLNQYFYLIQTDEHLNTNIYKIGKTEKYDPYDRLISYKKNFITYIIIKVKNASNFEANIIQKFRNIFSDPKKGNEYFEGDVNKMMNIIWEQFNFERDSC